jgi:hypothetical protein
MGDVLNEAYAIARCKECPWYKACTIPMRFTAEDLKKQIQESSTGTGQSIDTGMQGMLSNMAAAAQNSLLEGCPIFIERLRSSPKLSQKLKWLMQNWGSEELPKT